MKYVMLYHNTLYRYRTIRRYEAITSTVSSLVFVFGCILIRIFDRNESSVY